MSTAQDNIKNLHLWEILNQTNNFSQRFSKKKRILLYDIINDNDRKFKQQK